MGWETEDERAEPSYQTYRVAPVSVPHPYDTGAGGACRPKLLVVSPIYPWAGNPPEAAPRLRVAYNGCDAEHFRPATSRDAVRASVSFAPGRRYMVFCGSVIERKGITELATAWRSFAPRHPNWQLVIVGPIVSKALAVELLAAGPTSVRLVGRVPSDDVPYYLQAADGYVQPSHTEGIANATMEAMAVGLPVITTGAGGQGELVRHGENGWLVPVHDAPAVAQAMAELAGEPERAWSYGRQARAAVIERFHALTHAEHVSALLTELARRRAAT